MNHKELEKIRKEFVKTLKGLKRNQPHFSATSADNESETIYREYGRKHTAYEWNYEDGGKIPLGEVWEHDQQIVRDFNQKHKEQGLEAFISGNLSVVTIGVKYTKQ